MAVPPDVAEPSTSYATNGNTTNHSPIHQNGSVTSSPLSQKNANFNERLTHLRYWLNEFNEDEKKLFAREFLKECDVTNLEYISLLISQLRVARLEMNSTGNDPFLLFPNHITLRILSYMDPVSLCRCAKVSRCWRVFCDEPLLWRSLCNRGREFRMCSEEAETTQLETHRDHNGAVKWKEAFSERYRLWSNWHAGRCVVRTFTGHTQGIACVQFDSDRIVSGSTDTTIRIWDLRSASDVGNLGTMTLNGHSSTVRCLQLNKNVLASGSNDFSIKIWNVDVNPRWSSIGCRKTMLGHSNSVRCLQMNNENVLSGSYDMCLKLWSLNNGECVRTMVGHNDAVLCMQFRGEEHTAVSGSSDNSIKRWDTRTGQAAMTIHNAHENAVTCLRYDSQRIVSGSVDRMIKMWDIRTGRCIHTIDWKLAEGHTGVVRCLQADSWRIVSAADDKTIKVWNLDTIERLCTLQSHEDGVTCVEFNDKQIVSGSYDKTVKLWDFSVC